MKKIFILIFCIILLLSTISAFNFNVKSVSKEKDKWGYPEITVRDYLNIPILRNDLSKIKLEDHDPECLTNCYSKPSITIYKDEAIIEDIRFINKKGEKVNLSYEIKLNGKNYILGTILPKGNYYPEIFAEKKAYESIDYQLKINGEWINEMAWWSTTWSKKKQINLTDTSGLSVINYTVFMNIPYDADGNANFSDLRFTDSTETVELTNYEIKNKTDSSAADVLVKIPQTTASGITTIYMYYGNPGAGYQGNYKYVVNTTAHGITLDQVPIGGVTAYTGLKIIPNMDIQVHNITKSTDTTATNCYVLNSAKSPLVSGNFSGDSCRFAVPYNISSGTTYYFAVDSNGATYDMDYAGGTSYPYNFTYFGITASLSSTGADTTTAITSVESAGVSNSTNPIITYSIGSEINQNPLYVNLNSPIDYYNSSSQNINFSCNSTDDVGVLNLTLIINGIDNYTVTNSSANQNITLTRSLNLGDGSYNWTCRASDGTGDNEPITANVRHFTIDTTGPIINITVPLNTTYLTNYTESNYLNVELNWTSIDTHLDSCWFYNLSSGNNESITCGQNATMLLTYGQKTFLVYANDTFGNFGSGQVITTLDFGILKNNITYSNQTIEGALETFEFDFNISQITTETVDLVQITYNGTVYNASIISVSGENYIADVNLAISSISASTNFTFYFNVTMSDGTIYNTTGYNQTVLNLDADNCSAYNTTLFSFTLLDEGSQVNLTTLTNTTMELSMKLLSKSRSNYILNFSKIYEDINPAKICLNIAIPEDLVIPTDIIMKYYGDGSAKEYYNIFNFSLTNSSANQSINLYDLNISDSTEFKITLTGDNYLPIEGALINIDRQYVSENGSFKTVEIPITDTNGQTIGHFVKNDVAYNLIATKNGEVVSSLLNVKAFCEDLQLGNCLIVMDPNSASGAIFNYNNQGISFGSPTFNPNTSTVKFNFVSVDGVSKNILMSVNKNDIFGNRSICNDSLNSASGALSCSIPGDFADTRIVVEIYTNGELTAIRIINVDDSSYGDVGYIIWFVLTLVLIFIFGESKTGILISMSVSYIGAVSLGLTKGDLIGLGAAGIWVIVITIVGVWKLNSQRQQ